MIILALESSGPVASAAVLKDNKIISEKSGAFKVTHSETLMPLTKEALDDSGIALEDIDAIAVSGGPGSFTGLRIGSATAKGLGLALDRPLLHVPTLDALAYNLKGTEGFIVPIMDARRSQVYTGIYSFDGGSLKVHMAGCAMSIEELIERINMYDGSSTNEQQDTGNSSNEQQGTCSSPCDENSPAAQQGAVIKPDAGNGGNNAEPGKIKVIFLGDGVPVFKDVICEKCRADVSFADEKNLYQRAGSVALLGQVLADEGKFVYADDEAPEYLRPSQAERVREEQRQAAKQ